MAWTARCPRVLVDAARGSGLVDLARDLAEEDAEEATSNPTGSIRSRGMARSAEEHARGGLALGTAAEALETAGCRALVFGGWAVDLWVGRITRAHEDIDVLVWRSDERLVNQALVAAGWLHTPTPEDRVGTNYLRGEVELQLTFVVPGKQGGVQVPVPDQPIVLSEGLPSALCPTQPRRRDGESVDIGDDACDQGVTTTR